MQHIEDKISREIFKHTVKILKKTSLKMALGSTEGGIPTHPPLLAGGVTSKKKEDKNYLDKGGHFHVGISFSCYIKKKKADSLPAPVTVHSPPLAANEKPPQLQLLFSDELCLK